MDRPPLRARLLYLPLKVFFSLLYNQMAWTYDLVAATVSLGMWKSWVLAVLPYLKGPRVLELGHGPGHLQAALAQEATKGLQVFGLDLSPWMGRMARRRLLRLGFSPRLVNGNGQRLPFAAGSFDQIVATFPTEYILRPETLAEIYRVLAPGGQMVGLPLAYITGRRPEQRAAAWLFKTTGQAPQWSERALEPLQAAGFRPRVEWIDLPSSRLVVVVAEKVMPLSS